jgi:hypothetical protein
MRALLDPLLASRLKRLILANPNILRLAKPEGPEQYGIKPEDAEGPDTGEVEALAVRNDLMSYVHDFDACPMLAKYVRHAFIDYRKLSPANHDFNGFQQVKHVIQLMRHLKLNEYTDRDYGSKYWASTCGLAAMVLLILPNLESLILVGCDSHGYKRRDPIMAAAAAALGRRGQQIRLCALKTVYAWGCEDSKVEGYAPWGLLVLPSLETLECREVSEPVSIRFVPEGTPPRSRCKDHTETLWQCAKTWDQVCRLKSLTVRQTGLDCDSFYHLLEYTPHLKKLRFQCAPLREKLRYDYARGFHAERLGSAIQSLRECLEELTIEVDDVQDLWGFGDWDRDDDPDFIDPELDSEESTEEGSGDEEEVIPEEELKSLGLADEMDEVRNELRSQHQYFTEQQVYGIMIARLRAQVPVEDRQTLDFPFGSREPCWDDQHFGFLGSLAGFKKLKVITVPANALQDPRAFQKPEDGTSKRMLSGLCPIPTERKHLKDLLPESIEDLKVIKLQGSLQGLDEDIEDVLPGKSSCLPNLQNVEVKDPPSYQASESEKQLWKYTPLPVYLGFEPDELWWATHTGCMEPGPRREETFAEG